MKKIIVILILLLVSFQSVQGYNYNWKEYNIPYPENIEYLNYCYNSWNCEIPERFNNLIKLNNLLIKKWYDSIW